MRTFLHIDMNSYFATAEQQANPYLRGRPVGIVKAAGRGCVIAASVEAKRFGVKTGTTVWEAKRLCPQIILVPSDMDKYFSLTEKLIAVCKNHSPSVEVFSIDELFLDVTDVQHLYPGGALELALSIKQQIKTILGEWMRASIGVSFTKLLAKLASEMYKPDGLTFFTPTSYLEQTAHASVEDVCGIGYARTRFLHSHGVYTLGEARKIDLPIEIADLVWLRNCDPLVTLEDLQPAKSVSRTFTTFREVRGKLGMAQLVKNLVEEAAAKLREMDMSGRTFCLSLAANDHSESFWVRKTAHVPTSDGKVIFDLLWKNYLLSPIGGVRFAGVSISNLTYCYQYNFLEKEALFKAVDGVNQRFGLFTVYPASLLGGKLIRPEVTGYLGDKWYRFGENSLLFRK